MSTSKPDATPKPSTLPPKLQRLREAAKALAEAKAERDSWVKTALALELAELKKKPKR